MKNLFKRKPRRTLSEVSAEFAKRVPPPPKKTVERKREMKPLENVQMIQVKEGVTTITYKDGTILTTKDDITLGLDYKNENDIPLNDHCL